jgi:hypothetical protein
MVITLLNGCRVETYDPPAVSAVAPSAATLAVISSSSQGAQVASQVLQTRELAASSTQLFKNIGDISLSVMTPALSNLDTDIACSDGGTFRYTGTYTSSTGNYNLAFTFNGCRDKSYQYVGSTAVNGTPENFTVALGGASTFDIFNFNTAYTVLLAYLKANLSFTMLGSGTPTDALYTITSTGTITSFDYFLLDTFTMTFTALKSAFTLVTNGATFDQTISIIANGQFNESWAGTRFVSAQTTDFALNKTKYFDANTGTYYAEASSMTGTVLYTIRPAVLGYGGLFNVSGQTPIMTVYSPQRHTTQGTMIINGNATVQFNAGGDIDVNVSGDPLLNYTKEYELMKVCDFASMEQDKPPLITPPAPGTPVSLPTGSTMAVTLTWFGGATSDMDTHMEYYTMAAPVSSDTPTWHVYYATGKTCTDPTGIVFNDAVDVDGNGTCDVGLDFDDVQGYGPEHITALVLQPGYYKIYINNFSLDTDPFATIYSSFHVGDNIFGPYSFTFIPGNQTDYRIADVRVNANGSIDVLAPDPSLTP